MKGFLTLPEVVKRPQLSEHSISGLKNPASFDSFLSSIYVTRAPYKGVGGREGWWPMANSH